MQTYARVLLLTGAAMAVSVLSDSSNAQALAALKIETWRDRLDAETILSAWTEAKRTVNAWTPESTYHIFRADIDGNNLVQLAGGIVMPSLK